MAKQDLIRQARRLMLRSLDKVFPQGLNCKYIEQVMCTVDQCYTFDLMRKDIAYLYEKGYVRIVTIGGKGSLSDVKRESLTVITLTASGLEVAQNLREDQALEI